MKTLDGFSSRRNCYLIFAKNDIAKEPSADTVLFFRFLSLLFLFFLFFLSFPASLLSSWVGGYLVPPKGGSNLYPRLNVKTQRERERERDERQEIRKEAREIA